MERLGNSYSACWRNNILNKTGIEFLVKAVNGGFVYKDKIYNLGKRVW